jgi:hypothetical protein
MGRAWYLIILGAVFLLGALLMKKYVTFKNRLGKRIYLSRAAYDKYIALQAAMKRRGYDVEISDGLRLEAEQSGIVQKGASQTLRSAHRFGNAFDAWPFINGGFIFDTVKLWGQRKSMDFWMAYGQEARRLGGVIWGGDWDDDGIPVPQDPDEHLWDPSHVELKGGRIGEMLAAYPPDEQTDRLA